MNSENGGESNQENGGLAQQVAAAGSSEAAPEVRGGGGPVGGGGVQGQHQEEHGEGAPYGAGVRDQMETNGCRVGDDDPLLSGGGGDLRHLGGVGEEPGDSGEGSISNDNFREMMKEGTKVYECKVCNEGFDQPSKVRRHITLKHIKPANEMRAKQATPAGNKRGREE